MNFNISIEMFLLSVLSVMTELLFLEIPSCDIFDGKSVIIGCIYKPPDTNIKTSILVSLASWTKLTKKVKYVSF